MAMVVTSEGSYPMEGRFLDSSRNHSGQLFEVCLLGRAMLVKHRSSDCGEDLEHREQRSPLSFENVRLFDLRAQSNVELRCADSQKAHATGFRLKCCSSTPGRT